MDLYTVYVKTNKQGYITAVNSSLFLKDVTDWIEIDNGCDDKYYHAQGNYFPEPIETEIGAYRYKLVDGVLANCTEEEIIEQETNIQSGVDAVPTTEERIAELETQNEMLLQCILEMSEIVYA